MRYQSPIARIASTATLLLLAGAAHGAENWFVSFEGIDVAPVARDNVSQLVDAGAFDANGFRDLVFSLGGEFREGLPRGGRVGAILLPDEELVDQLLRGEGTFVFPFEVWFDVNDPERHIFISEQKVARVAFPRYRVYFYNETTSGARVSLYVYRSR